jgi:hypothetical protein
MKLILIRELFNSKQTLGKLYVNGVYLCDTLEDTYRDLSKVAKVYGQTCIPNGIYKVVNQPSVLAKKSLPLLLDVPYFSYIRIHCGNTELDTEGCILVGTLEGNHLKYGSSTIAFNKLWELVKDLTEYSIEIKNK